MKPWKLFSGCIALFWLVLVFAPSQAQSGLAQIAITGITYDSYPQVNVQVRAVNENGQPVTGLGTSSFQVTEDGTPQTISVSNAEGGIYVHFIIDAGPPMVTGDRWQKAQNAILSFVANAAEPRMSDDDIVEVSVLEGTGGRQIIPPTSDRANIVQVVSSYRPPASSDTQYRAPLDYVETWVDSLVANRAVEGRPTIIVVLTANFGLYNTAQINGVAAKAKAGGTPIYTFLVRDQSNNESSAVASLATQSGGEHFHLQNNAVLVPAYDSIETYRQQYVLSYDSRGSLSGTRRVQVSAENGVEATASYVVQIQPPVITIVAPVANQIIPRISDVFIPNDELSLILPTEQTVRATVEFPDGYPRRLNSAELFVNGTAVDTATGTRELEFIWDLREGQQAGSTTYELGVEIEDVLGLRATAETKATVVLDNKKEFEGPPEAIATQMAQMAAESDARVAAEATRFAIAEATRIATEEELKARINAAITKCTWSEEWEISWICSPEKFLRDNWFGFIGIGIAIGAVAFVSTSKSAPAQNIRNTVRHAVERVTNRYRKQAVRAYLLVEEGDPALVGQNLEVYGDTPIGRSLEVAHLLFHQTNPNTPISRLHCTLLDKEDHFEIQDEDSANGTIVNGKRLRALEPYTLQDGDKIELAPVARGGVRLRFQLALDGDSGMTQAEGGIRTTRDTRNSSSQKDVFDD